MDFRTRIKELCQEQGITQKELAEKMGISDISLNKTLRGEYPQLQTLEKIANTLNVPIAELFEKPNVSNIIGFVKVGDTVHEVKSVEDVKDLAGKL
ncbi:helix-turn-helix transcriptional regulator [Bacteroides caccae]|jgi:transcriptional regulator with XRE-family HTH domain|uniref:Helix-turn-helix transcriptional regulator n=1 Tax=Bacteroides caccae TaxID=47678 RepID=A0AA94Y7U3_9BACE|nr:helix-turn-helix transcriptional regulator [Bacteroides caccae]